MTSPFLKRLNEHQPRVWESLVLITYGFVLTSVGLLVQAGAISASRHADSQALAWHAYLWDPWFLVWGLLVILTLRTADIRLRRPSS